MKLRMIIVVRIFINEVWKTLGCTTIFGTSPKNKKEDGSETLFGFFGIIFVESYLFEKNYKLYKTS